jgi:hypothetical protein
MWLRADVARIVRPSGNRIDEIRPVSPDPLDSRSSAAVLSKGRWERGGLPRWTTGGVTCPSAGSSALHRGHRAGVVPALTRVLLVRRVTRVLATVVAAELLAWLDLASAPHVLAVHPTSSPVPRGGPPLLAQRCMPSARCVNLSGFTRSVPLYVHAPFETDGRTLALLRPEGRVCVGAGERRDYVHPPQEAQHLDESGKDGERSSPAARIP